jgi:iron(III) transport system substrate-binding protein
MTRRRACLLGAAALLAGCEGKPRAAGKGASSTPGPIGAAPTTATPTASSNAPTPPPPPAQAVRSIVVYCSADSDLAKPMFESFTKKTGIAVNPVFDTEATKTTGLVMRLLQEKDRARADACWFSEPFGTLRLARAGVLDDTTSRVAEAEMKEKDGWPRLLRDQRWLEDKGSGVTGPRWYGFGSRARVIAFNTRALKREEVPVNYAPLTVEPFAGRIGMARPQFGTTRGHMASLVNAWGRGNAGDWMRALKGGNVRIYDGNGAVARAVGSGEIHVGFVDSDDVFAGQREKWPIDMAFIKCNNPGAKRVPRSDPKWGEFQSAAGTGTLMLPNTISRVRGGQNGAGALELADFLLSRETQRAMAMSESRNVPVDPDMARELATWLPPEDDRIVPDLEDIADVMDVTMNLCESIFG